MGTAKQLSASLGSSVAMAGPLGCVGGLPASLPTSAVGNAAASVPAAFAAGRLPLVPTPDFLQRSQSNMELQQLATAAHLQSAHMQAWAQDTEMQRMQIAMQMQVAAATELQTQEQEMQRKSRAPSPEVASGRKRRRGEKETTEYFYDMEMADQKDREQPGVAASDLVEKVKVIKRSSPRGYNAWDSYCLSKGNKTKDPRLHHDDFLRGFFEAISQGEFGEVPGAVAVLGDGAAKRFEPQPTPYTEGRNSNSAPTKVIFIAGLPKFTKADELSSYFSAHFGKVAEVRLKFDDEGTFRGIGEVEFMEDAAGRRVLDNFDHNIFQGKWINCMVSRFRKSSAGRSAQWTTYVG